MNDRGKSDGCVVPAKLPNNPDVMAHLGLAYAKLGDKAKSRTALERALKLNPKVGGEDARRTLADVSR